MKLIYLIIIIISLIGSGCTDRSDEKDTPEFEDIKTYSHPESKEEFSILYPDWEEAESDDPFNNITLRYKQCRFALNIVDAPVVWYEKAVTNFVIENNGAILSESPLSYTLASGPYTFKTQTEGIFCDDRTYFVLFSCLEDQFDEVTAKNILNSMNCEKEWETPTRDNKKLSMVVSPQNTTDIKSYFKAFNQARDNNVQMTHYYASWGEVVKNDWENNNFLMSIIENKGLKTSIAFDIIHTSVIGELPEDIEFKRWDDLVLISEFSEFVIQYIERYKDTIEYVEIGNEVDIYLNSHPDELDTYRIFYKEVYDNIKKAHPEMKVGTVFAYHTLKSNNNFEVYDGLSTIGDFDAFTLYIYNPGFIFNRDPVEIYKHLKEIEKLTGERNYAMVEVGWNAYEKLEGTEEDQRQAVNYFFDYLEEAPDRLEFSTWFLLHDGTKEGCLKSAKTFIEPGDPILENEAFMGPFSDFICYLGLIESDGNQRMGWHEFTERAREYAGKN